MPQGPWLFKALEMKPAPTEDADVPFLAKGKCERPARGGMPASQRGQLPVQNHLVAYYQLTEFNRDEKLGIPRSGGVPHSFALLSRNNPGAKPVDVAGTTLVAHIMQSARAGFGNGDKSGHLCSVGRRILRSF